MTHYPTAVCKTPILTKQEEEKLLADYAAGNKRAGDKVVEKHMRLAASMAKKYKDYGFDKDDLIAEAYLGLAKALSKYRFGYGTRFGTYASYWIRDALNNYAVNNWSSVKAATTASQRKLFFNIIRVKKALAIEEGGSLRPESIMKIADILGVNEADVIVMNDRMSGRDFSLNVIYSEEDGDTDEWQDMLEDDTPDVETRYAEAEEFQNRLALMKKGMRGLTAREKDILRQRQLTDPRVPLQVLADKYGLTRERIRQIEVAAFTKVQRKVIFLNSTNKKE